MPETIRERLRRILNADPAQRIAQPDRARQPIETAAAPAQPPAAASAPAASKPVVTAPSDVTQVSARAVPSIEPAQPERATTTPAPMIEPVAADVQPAPVAPRPNDRVGAGDIAEAQAFIESLRQKMAALAEDFALGRINRQQFESVYVHYREQRQMVESLLTSMTSSTWRKAVAEGETAVLLRRSTAKVLSYALYDNDSSLLLASHGSFKIDPAVVVPMLSAYRSAAQEAFGAGIRDSEIEGGRWLTFLPGRYTTLIVLFSIQPAREQLEMLEDLHRDFETANAEALLHGQGQAAAEQFMRLWAIGRGA